MLENRKPDNSLPNAGPPVDPVAAERAMILYATAPTLEVAEAIAGELVDRRLAACVNLIPGMLSIYRWQGRRNRDSEVVMIVKTRTTLAGAATAAILERHPYEAPAVLALDVTGGAPGFLAWIMAETGPAAGS